MDPKVRGCTSPSWMSRGPLVELPELQVARREFEGRTFWIPVAALFGTLALILALIAVLA